MVSGFTEDGPGAGVGLSLEMRLGGMLGLPSSLVLDEFLRLCGVTVTTNN